MNTHEAKSRLSELIRLAEAGDTVLIARNGNPVVALRPWPGERPRRVRGSLRGRLDYRDDDLIGRDAEIEAMFDESSAALT